MLIKINVSDARPGMFVSDLDRPWIDTPFLMQGFLIESPDEIATLRTHCKYIYVDPSHSSSDVVAIFRPYMEEFAEEDSETPFDWGATDEQKRGSRGPVLDLTGLPRDGKLGDTARFNQLVASKSEIYLKKANRKQAGQGKEAQAEPTDQPNVLTQIFDDFLGMFRFGSSSKSQGRHVYVPKSVKLVSHIDSNTIQQEYPRVLEIFAKAGYTMAALVADALAGRKLAIDDVEEVSREMVGSMLRNMNALMLVTMIKEQGASLYGQGLRVAVYMIALGRHIGLPRAELVSLGMVGLLLDIGKTTLPLKVLTKPGRLDDEEFELARTHVNRGVELLQQADRVAPDVLRGIAEHHERENGSGYPNALKGDDVTLYGRIAALVDCFVALTNDRSYATALTPYYAMRNLVEWSGSLFHAPLVEQFIQTVGVFPVGSIVELSSKEVGVVVSQNANQRLKPKVLKVWGADKQYLPSPEYVDLLRQGTGDADDGALRIVRGLPRRSFDLDNFELLRHLTSA